MHQTFDTIQLNIFLPLTIYNLISYYMTPHPDYRYETYCHQPIRVHDLLQLTVYQ